MNTEYFVFLSKNTILNKNFTAVNLELGYLHKYFLTKNEVLILKLKCNIEIDEYVPNSYNILFRNSTYQEAIDALNGLRPVDG